MMKNKYFFLLSVFVTATLLGYIFLPAINNFLGLPTIDNLTEYEPISSIELYDYRDNFVGFLQGEEDRQVVPLSEISPFLKRAILAIEDKNFYEHIGIDPPAIFRAFFVNLQAGRVVEGGSTLTQQLVKNLLIPEKERGRTFTRKFKELFLALEMERKLNKDRILELYLNQVFWGNRAYGAQRAAQRYFNKKASELTLAEAAYLGGLLKAPSALSSNRKSGEERKQLVLKKMLEFGYITQKQYNSAIKEKLQFTSSPGQFELYPFYFSYVLEELKDRFDLEQLKEKGYKVYTSLDPEAQDKAEKILNEEIKKAPSGVTQFALVAVDVKTAQIRALVGGVGDFWKNQWNRATNPHTIGSAFKPFIYLTAFEQGVIDPDTKIKDSKFEIVDGTGMVWAPKNFDGEFRGTITVREALTYSRNLPAVKVAYKVGMEKIIDMAKACGIETKLEPHLALSLGSAAITPLEAASSYATFARGGIYIKPILIRRIEDPKKRIIEKNVPVPQRVVSAYAASTLVSVMEEVVKRGTGTLAKLSDRPVAGKTGTSDKSRDVWFIGFTPDLSVAIWGGNDHNKAINSRWVTGGAIVARVWKRFCESYYEDKDIPPGAFPQDVNMKIVLVDPLTGLLATPYTSNPVKKLFVPGTEPKEYAPIPGGAGKFKSFTKLLYGPFSNKNKLEDGEFDIEDDFKDKKDRKENNKENTGGDDEGDGFVDEGKVINLNSGDDPPIPVQSKERIQDEQQSEESVSKARRRRMERLRDRRIERIETEEVQGDNAEDIGNEP